MIKPMKGKDFCFSMAVVLAVALIGFSACSNKKKEGELSLQVQTLEGKISQIEAQVLEKEGSIGRLTTEKENLEKLLPEVYSVQPGDSHWKIAYAYLTERKGVSDEEARRLLHAAPLSAMLLPGNRIVNSLNDGILGTAIAQGDAGVSPAALERIERKKNDDRMAAYEAQVAELKSEREALNRKIDDIVKSSETLKSEIASVRDDLAGVRSEKADLESRLNSVYYLAETKGALKASKKIKGSFLGLCGTDIDSVTAADFKDRIDLRQTQAIELKASDFGLSRIKKVAVYPKHLGESGDLKVDLAAEGATVRFQNTDRFLKARILLSIE